jgi:2-methylcitrate dehydratase PrpD
MNLDPERFAWAIGICGSFCSGTMEFLSDPEPWSKRIQVGYAGQGAILAARAASHGFKGPLTILEGRHGYFNSHAGAGNFDVTGVCDALGSDWQLMSIYAKRYPCDHLAQGYVDCAIALGSVDGVVPQRIRRIECIVHPLVVSIGFEPHEMRYLPGNGWAARWSLPFAVAVAMSDRALSIDSYTDERARDDATRALMAKVTYTPDPSLVFPNDYPAWVRVHMVDGQVLEHQLPKVIGTPENPMGVDEYEAKFFDNARRSIEPARASRLVSRLQQVSTLSDMSELAALYG